MAEPSSGVTNKELSLSRPTLNLPQKSKDVFPVSPPINFPELKLPPLDLTRCVILNGNKEVKQFISEVWDRKVEEKAIKEVTVPRLKALRETFIREESFRWCEFYRKKGLNLNLEMLRDQDKRVQALVKVFKFGVVLLKPIFQRFNILKQIVFDYMTQLKNTPRKTAWLEEMHLCLDDLTKVQDNPTKGLSKGVDVTLFINKLEALLQDRDLKDKTRGWIRKAFSDEKKPETTLDYLKKWSSKREIDLTRALQSVDVETLKAFSLLETVHQVKPRTGNKKLDQVDATHVRGSIKNEGFPKVQKIVIKGGVFFDVEKCGGLFQVRKGSMEDLMDQLLPLAEDIAFFKTVYEELKKNFRSVRVLNLVYRVVAVASAIKARPDQFHWKGYANELEFFSQLQDFFWSARRFFLLEAFHPLKHNSFFKALTKRLGHPLYEEVFRDEQSVEILLFLLSLKDYICKKGDSFTPIFEGINPENFKTKLLTLYSDKAFFLYLFSAYLGLEPSDLDLQSLVAKFLQGKPLPPTLKALLFTTDEWWQIAAACLQALRKEVHNFNGEGNYSSKVENYVLDLSSEKGSLTIRQFRTLKTFHNSKEVMSLKVCFATTLSEGNSWRATLSFPDFAFSPDISRDLATELSQKLFHFDKGCKLPLFRIE